MKHTIRTLCFLIFFSQVYIAQTAVSENTITLDSGNSSPKASINDVEWITGHWKGKAFGGEVEEIWTPPLGGSMMCAFKSVVDGKVKFYEFIAIIEENESLILRLKHFHHNLKGWEEKDETVDFPLVKITENKVNFDGFTIKKISENELNVFVMIGGEDKAQEVKFNYKRVSEV